MTVAEMVEHQLVESTRDIARSERAGIVAPTRPLGVT
jgi:hypothetical protein